MSVGGGTQHKRRVQFQAHDWEDEEDDDMPGLVSVYDDDDSDSDDADSDNEQDEEANGSGRTTAAQRWTGSDESSSDEYGSMPFACFGTNGVNQFTTVTGNQVNVGERVQVHWPAEQQDYTGTVEAVSANGTETFTVRYDDGVTEDHPIADTGNDGLRVTVLRTERKQLKPHHSITQYVTDTFDIKPDILMGLVELPPAPPTPSTRILGFNSVWSGTDKFIPTALPSFKTQDS
jgi:hypothetical protein